MTETPLLVQLSSTFHSLLRCQTLPSPAWEEDIDGSRTIKRGTKDDGRRNGRSVKIIALKKSMKKHDGEETNN
jgi:hypothetical protein